MTEIKSGPALRKIQGSALKAVMRRDEARARDYAQRHGVPRWYGKAVDLLADPEVDAVYVASPPSSHFELGRLVAQAGKPCYVEKPMGASSSDARGLIDVFAQAGLPLFPAFYRRGLRKFRKVREHLAQDVIGKIEEIHYGFASNGQLTGGGWRLDPVVSGGGLFVDLGSHVLDLLDFWFGPLELKSSIAENRSGRGGLADRVQARLITPEQMEIELEFDFARNGEPQDFFYLRGSRGSLSFSAFDLGPLRYEGILSFAPDDDFAAQHVQQGLLENVMDCLRGKAQPWATPQAALRTWKLMEKALRNGQP